MSGNVRFLLSDIRQYTLHRVMYTGKMV